METALKGVPVAEMTAPSGVVTVGGEVYFDDYAPGRGVSSLGVDSGSSASSSSTPSAESLTGAPVPQPAPPEERNRILDLFRN